MGLTDGGLLWLLVLLTLAAIVATVVWWRRLAGRSPWAVLGRAGVVLGTNLLVVLTAAVALNDSYLFYVSWSDLFGSMQQTVVTAHAGGSVADAFAAPRAKPGQRPDPPSVPAGPLPPNPADHSRQVQYTVHGSRSGITAPVVVILPAGYFDAANATRRYPVIEAFPGYPGSAIGVPKHFDLAGVNDALAAHGKMSPVIWVIPTAWVPPGTDTECVNGPPGSTQTETWLTSDVPQWLRAHYRVQPQRTSWATFGMSAGGWCAAMATFLHPQQYGAAIVLGGYFHPDWGNWIPFPDNSPEYRRYDLVTLARTAPPPVALYDFTSTQDSLSYPSSQALLASAKAPLSVTADVAASGGHRLSTWTPVFPTAMEWLGSHVPGFAPTN